jgi:hypothetical protein
MSAGIVYLPYKKIVVHEAIKYSFDELVSEVLLQARALGGTSVPSIGWCEGVAFIIQQFPLTDAIVEEMLRGVVHYAGVLYAIKENYEPEVRTPMGIVRLINRCNNPNFVRLARFLKELDGRG